MSQPVPFVTLDRQHAVIASELNAAFQRVVGESAFVLGGEVSAFEEEYAAYCGAAHAAGTNSGTAALTLALQAAGIGPGDEVIVPAHTFIASSLAVVHTGATPVFCDVHADTGLIDADAARAAVTDKTAAILPVHLYGQCCDMAAIREVAAPHDLFVLEDAAQAHGATWRGKRAGTLGDAAAFSFYPSKNLGALGEGGAVVSNDAGIAQRVRELRHIGQRGKGEHVHLGWNERLHGLQAAMLRVKLPHLDVWNEARRTHAAHYRELLGESVGLLAETSDSPCVFHLFPIRVGDRDAIAATLGAAGIQTGVHYTPACCDQPPMQEPGRIADDAVNARAWAADELSLPMAPELRVDEIERSAAAVRSVVGGYAGVSHGE